MKVLWITYAPLGRAAELIEKRKAQSGTWIDATAKALLENEKIELGIACIASQDVELFDDVSGVRFFGVGNVKQSLGKIAPDSDCLEWKSVIDRFTPDVIMVWGTEYANGLSILNVAENIPVLFFVQGVMGRIVDYPLGLMPKKEVLHIIGPISMLKFFHFLKMLKQQRRQKKIECQMVTKSAGIITDNQWANSYYRLITTEINIFHLPLPVNQGFLENQYDIDNFKRHSIFTIDGSNPAKGMFHLLKAIKKVKEFFPDVHLYIPGRVPSRKPRIFFESPYYTYLKKLLKKLDIEGNVTFCGQLNSEQMKERLLSCEVFVMPSCVENHSSSLREAMYLGVPCVTAMVGSVDEFTQYGENVLSYRYEEEDVLADSIIRIFQDKQLAKKIGENAYRSIRECYPQEGLGKRLFEIYEAVKNE